MEAGILIPNMEIEESGENFIFRYDRTVHRSTLIPIWQRRVETCPQGIVSESDRQRSTIGDPIRVRG
jgi:hypothetical protein